MTFTKGIIQRSPGATEESRAFEQEEKEKRAAELVLANIELAYQNEQKEQRAQELVIANRELAYQNDQKEKRAAELALANIELAYQNEQKEPRAQELIVANRELAYQNEQKEQRAQELIIANRELAYQNDQKERRAAELVLANIELAYQNEQKEQRAQELIVANRELAYQNAQKEKRAQELVIANQELAYQNDEKEQRAQELADALKDLEAFAYVSSHHLQEPLRKILSFVDKTLVREAPHLSDKGKYDLQRIDVAATRMRQLIQDIYTYSRINVNEQAFETVHIGELVATLKREMLPGLEQAHVQLELDADVEVVAIPAQMRQALHHLLDNALKFASADRALTIKVTARLAAGSELNDDTLSPDVTYCSIEVSDNGIGFHQQYGERIFEIFQKLHTVEEYSGTGIGLAIVKKIMDRHQGHVSVTGVAGVGTAVRLLFPAAGLPA
ncbi:MAG: His Kinase (Phospho-acceptor) protein [Flaviaesturariibacter sp.]|nr:His Kinase (Phospho-acceptor) protein [Flaviaesturariibacter sp.]